ncbi:hypothetical protein BdWA1_000424 [Babesia duncani]|uniref:Uncharacterized protein n=1 Tax=Babesia duncani TaxID=323732 RepID=A0AAD9UPZ8_9APIC|nr:hypothetical protein BdWA1_000424 [Babesia duncani]
MHFISKRYSRLGNCALTKSSSPFSMNQRHYTKHVYESRGIRRFLGPFWVFTTPPFLLSWSIVASTFLLLLYPLDGKLFNVRKLVCLVLFALYIASQKAELDAKVGS